MKTILVPLDFSPVSEAVLETVKVFAVAHNAEVVLLHVEAPEPDFVGYGPGPQVVRHAVAEKISEHHEKMHAMRDGLKEAGVEAKALVIQGGTVDKILEEAKRLEADLIILGSHGHGAVFDLLVGSVTDGVIRKATVPVVVVPSQLASGETK